MRLKQFMLICFAMTIIAGCQILPQGENVLIQEVYNPGISLKAIVFEKSGNATVGNSIQVLIENKDYKLKDTDTGNVFICDQFEDIGMENTQVLKINWKSDSTLIISYPNALRVFKKAATYDSFLGKIALDYQSK